MSGYRFKINYRQFRAGDEVPDSYPPGVVRSLLDYGRIERVNVEDKPAKKRGRPPKNKAIKSPEKDKAA